MRRVGKFISAGLVATTLVAGMATSAPAQARDWDRGRANHHHHRGGGGGNDGALIALGAIVGIGALMALNSPAPARSYAPPRVVYEDDYYEPRRCQEFQRDEYRHGTVYRSYYTACQAPDGRWYPQ